MPSPLSTTIPPLAELVSELVITAPSIMVSLFNTLPVVTGVSSVVEYASSTATGLPSSVTVIISLAVAVPPLPSLIT